MPISKRISHTETRSHGGIPPTAVTLHLRVSVPGPLPVNGAAMADAASAAHAPEVTGKAKTTDTLPAQTAAREQLRSRAAVSRTHGALAF